MRIDKAVRLKVAHDHVYFELSLYDNDSMQSLFLKWMPQGVVTRHPRAVTIMTDDYTIINATAERCTPQHATGKKV